jgi:hypothetical protein
MRVKRYWDIMGYCDIVGYWVLKNLKKNKRMNELSRLKWRL